MGYKKKTLKIFLSYVFLIILVAMLALPPVFRATFVEEVKVKEQIVTTLECIKNGETIKGTFLNEDPQVIIYNLKGDFRIKNTSDIYDNDYFEFDNVGDENTSSETDNSSETSSSTDNTIVYNELLEKLREFAMVTYDDKENTTTLKVEAKAISSTNDYKLIFSNINNQETYYKNHGFTCSRTSTKF